MKAAFHSSKPSNAPNPPIQKSPSVKTYHDAPDYEKLPLQPNDPSIETSAPSCSVPSCPPPSKHPTTIPFGPAVLWPVVLRFLDRGQSAGFLQVIGLAHASAEKRRRRNHEDLRRRKGRPVSNREVQHPVVLHLVVRWCGPDAERFIHLGRRPAPRGRVRSLGRVPVFAVLRAGVPG